MQVPNMLFYDNMINCGYQNDSRKKFLYSDNRFLFLDIQGKEILKGTSFVNFAEVLATEDLVKVCLTQFAQAKGKAKFQKRDICVITPYNAQKNALVDQLLKHGMEDQVISIDSSQGREFDIVFLSMVRTKPGNFIQEYNRINVAITRAKHGLVIIGKASNLRNEPGWDRLLREHEANVVSGIKGFRDWILEHMESSSEDENH